jgi:hypothetical protein
MGARSPRDPPWVVPCKADLAHRLGATRVSADTLYDLNTAIILADLNAQEAFIWPLQSERRVRFRII